jgi:hypothetical protein|tara:strand:+ start:1658 stop:1930 length:273 start_codon:yes stop_codon:yes gene_type:complete
MKKKLVPTRKLLKPRFVEQLPFTDKEVAEVHLNVKEHVLKGICTYCSKKVSKKLFKGLAAKHDYHLNGMCKPCLIEMEKEPLLESDRWKN